MPLRTYEDLVDEFPKAHLVVATVAAAASLKPAHRLLVRLLEAFKPKGDYALGDMQDGHHWAVHCVFELKPDAVQLAAAVQAKPVGRYAGFASQRAFWLDAAAQEAIATVLDELDKR